MEYSTSEDGASMEYCPECQKAIDKALKKIPVKFKPEQMEIVEVGYFNDCKYYPNSLLWRIYLEDYKKSNID